MRVLLKYGHNVRVWLYTGFGQWSDLLDSLTHRVTTFYNSLLYTQTSLHSHTFTSRCPVAASKGGRTSFSRFPNCPRASATSFSQQQFTATEPQQFSNSLTRQPTSLHFTDWLSCLCCCTGRTENTVPLLLCNCCRGNMLVCEAVT
jgi:hypothetical protein